MIYDSFEPHYGWMMSSEYLFRGCTRTTQSFQPEQPTVFLTSFSRVKNIMAVEKMNVFVYVER